MNYFFMAFIAYSIAGTITTLVHIESVERAMAVKGVDHPAMQAYVMIIFILTWPYIVWPQPRRKQHR